MTIDECLNYIHSRPRVEKYPPEKRMKFLMNRFNNPQDKIKTVQITGTNGKGSCVAFLSSLLMEAGLKVGTFTSPYLIKFNERISVNQIPISDEDLIHLVKMVKPVIDKIDRDHPDLAPTEFDLDCALMFVYFSQLNPVNVVLVEAGIGGSSDSTNVIKRPLVSIVTTIGWDHMNLLGNTKAAIAQNKAGIIKPGGTVVVGQMNDSLFAIMKDRASLCDDSITGLGRDFRVTSEKPHSFNFKGKISIKDVPILMNGKFEIDDAAIAIEAFLKLRKSLKLNVDNTAALICRGIKKTRWPGRMEIVAEDPTVMIDGAHNLSAVSALISSLKGLSYNHISLILAVFADKQSEKMLAEFERLPNIDITLCRFEPEQKRKAENWPKLLTENSRIRIEPNWKKAVRCKISTNKRCRGQLILVTGSLFFISEVRKFILNFDEK